MKKSELVWSLLRKLAPRLSWRLSVRGKKKKAEAVTSLEEKGRCKNVKSSRFDMNTLRKICQPPRQEVIDTRGHPTVDLKQVSVGDLKPTLCAIRLRSNKLLNLSYI